MGTLRDADQKVTIRPAFAAGVTFTAHRQLHAFFDTCRNFKEKAWHWLEKRRTQVPQQLPKSTPGKKVEQIPLAHGLFASVDAADYPKISEYKWHAARYGRKIYALCKKNGKTVIAGDGQVSMGNTVMKPNARKVRRIGEGGKVVAGFAGATADAFTLFERLEKKLEQYSGQLLRAAVELAKDWRTDKYLRNLEALMIVADSESLLVLTGNGDVLEPEAKNDSIIAAIGSGGNYALAAGRALAEYEEDADTIARKAMEVAADICVFTNGNVTLETV